MTVADLRTARLTSRGLRESDTEAAVEVFAAPEMGAPHDFSEAAARLLSRGLTGLMAPAVWALPR